MRWSELVGLRRSRIDLRTRKVRVTEQLVWLGPKQWERKEPKTPASIRSINISSVTADILTEHLETFAHHGADDLVFVNAAAGPLVAQSFLTHPFGPARRRLGLTCRFHDLRHTSVALAIAAGAHPKAIQARTGDSSINVTLDRYGHLFPDLDESLALAFGEQLAKARSERQTPTVIHAAFGNRSPT
jgi:integrase